MKGEEQRMNEYQRAKPALRKLEGRVRSAAHFITLELVFHPERYNKQETRELTNTLSWYLAETHDSFLSYVSGNASYQCNYSGLEYFWVAIG